MSFNSAGYNIRLIQVDACKDETQHELTYIFKFFSPITKLRYIIRAEYYTTNLFIVKFYPQCLSNSDHKYSKIINRGDMPNIVTTCCKVVPYLLERYRAASFGFMGGRSIDRLKNNKRAEELFNNQRFRIYRQVALSLFGQITFTHIEYKTISSYMLFNNLNESLEEKEMDIKQSLVDTYPDLLNYF